MGITDSRELAHVGCRHVEFTAEEIQLVEEMAAVACTQEEIAARLGCSVPTIAARFGSVLARGRATMAMSLRARQFTAAMRGNPQLLIWLGKQLLGQSEKSEVNLGGQLSIAQLSIERAEYADLIGLIEEARPGVLQAAARAICPEGVGGDVVVEAD